MSMHNRNAAYSPGRNVRAFVCPAAAFLKKTGLWCYSMFGVFLKNSSS